MKSDESLMHWYIKIVKSAEFTKPLFIKTYFCWLVAEPMILSMTGHVVPSCVALSCNTFSTHSNCCWRVSVYWIEASSCSGYITSN